MEKRPTFIREYFRIVMGLIVFLTGCALVSHIASYDSYSFWFIAGTIILGVTMLSMGDGIGVVFGILMMLTGASILLHQMGILATPYFAGVIGWVFMSLGGLMILAFSLKIIKKWKSNDPGDSGVDDLDKVDY